MFVSKLYPISFFFNRSLDEARVEVNKNIQEKKIVSTEMETLSVLT